MKKSVVLVFLLLSVSVYAGVNIPYDSKFTDDPGNGITRYSDFPLDNIHILRLQEAAASLGGNVTLLKQDLAKYDAEHKASQADYARQLSLIQDNLDSFQRSVLAQMSSVQTSIQGLATAPVVEPVITVEAPSEVTFPPYVFVLLGLNVFLLVLVIVLIFWLREQYYVHRETHSTDHIHPAPKDLIDYVRGQVERKKSLHELRLELASKGWTPSIIEHAIHAAREK